MTSNTEKLIEKIRENSILYDLSNKDYKNIKKKDKIWDTIAESLGEKDGDTLKKRWKNLRDCFAKFLRSEKVQTGQEMKSLERYKTWPWAAQMGFLKPFLAFSKTQSNLHSIPQISEETIEEIYEIEPLTPMDLIETCVQPTPKRRKKDIKQSTAVSQVIFYLDKKTEPPSDDNDDLFRGYAKTMKKFSKRRQALLKFKLSKLFLEAEIEQINEDEEMGSNQSISSVSQERITSTPVEAYSSNYEEEEFVDASIEDDIDEILQQSYD